VLKEKGKQNDNSTSTNFRRRTTSKYTNHYHVGLASPQGEQAKAQGVQG